MWAVPLEELAKTKTGVTHERWLRVLKDEAFNLIRELPILETRPEHLLNVMEVGTVSTNVFLRRVHNFALDMGWLPWPVIRWAPTRSSWLTRESSRSRPCRLPFSHCRRSLWDGVVDALTLSVRTPVS